MNNSTGSSPSAFGRKEIGNQCLVDVVPTARRTAMKEYFTRDARCRFSGASFGDERGAAWRSVIVI
jgi:hypothetical protein